MVQFLYCGYFGLINFLDMRDNPSFSKLIIIKLVILIGLFIIIRMFENQLFYDPFLDYFKSESTLTYPNYNSSKLYFNLLVRYFLNTITSLSIVYIIFKDLNILKFSAILYLVFFIILVIGFYVFLNYFDESQKLILFYIRRFIIQPIFILLFLPAFYFQKLVEKKERLN